MKRLALGFAFLLLFSACKVRVEFDTVVNEDGSGKVSFAIGFDEEFRETLETFAAFGDGVDGDLDFSDPFSELREDVPEGWEVEEFADGEIEGIRVTREFSDLDELRSALQATRGFGQGDEEFGAPSSPGLSEISIERDGDLITVNARTEASDFPGSAGESPFGSDSPFGFEGSPFGELELEMIIRFTLPGEVIEHNADEQQNGTLIWRFDENSDATTISAVADASKSGDSDFPLGIVVGIVAALGVAAGFFVALQRRRSAAVAGSEVAPPPGPSGEED